MAELGTFETLLSEAGRALLPLKNAVSSPQNFFALMLKLGWQAEDVPQPLQDLGAELDSLFVELQKIVGAGLAMDGSISLDSASASISITIDDILRLKNAVQRIINGIEAIATAPDSAFPASLLADHFKEEFPKQLINYLLINYLTTYHDAWAFAFRALGIIKTRYVPASGGRLSYVHYTIDFSDIPTVLENPRLVLENAFGWGTDDFDYRAFASQVDNLLSSIGVDVFVEEMRRDVATKIEGNVDLPGDPVRKAIKAVIFERARPSGRMVTEIRLLYLPKTGSQKPGLALLPSFNGLLDFKMQLGSDIAVIIKSNLDLQGGVALLLRPDHPIDMLLGFNNPGAPTQASGTIEVGVERSQLNNAPFLILGKANESRLQYRKLGGSAGLGLSSASGVDVFAEFELKGLEFILQPSESDGFIRKIFPADGVGLGFDLAVGVSYIRGFYFRGASHLEIAVPAHIQIGPIDLQSLLIAANPQADKVPITVGATVRAVLGPLTAVVENIGLTSTFSFPGNNGNLGPVDLALSFKPPNGVGLAVDAGVVKGGGYLFFDFDKEEYAGALELVFSGFLTLKAIGLITTRLPDGSKGFSLLIIITAEFGTGVQLGFGFVLLGVGGLLGLNRTMKLQPLAEGVRTGATESVLFPQNIIENAPRLISDLRRFFPPEDGIFLIGPMAKLGWGTPALITLSLGIIIEIPGNIAILGVLKVVLPDEKAALLVLQVNFIGAIEFDKQRAFFFASIFESRVLFITIEGEMGVLVAWGNDSNFVVSVGGFHPQFTPPPLPFPSPKRVSLNILNESWGRIRVMGYFAVTSNTVQLGVRAELFFGFSAFKIEGHLAFDALFQFNPFFFIIEISCGVSLKVFGIGLFSISLQFSLSGTNPWRAKGYGKLKLLFFSIKANFDFTWGEKKDTSLPPIEILPLLVGELEKLSNWKAQLPASNTLLVSLRMLEGGSESLVLHPVGTLTITQRAVPLDLRLDKVGNQKPSDGKRFYLNVASGLKKVADLSEPFAIAQFQDFKDADKLSQAAFQPEDAGLELAVSDQSLATGMAVKRNIRYETHIIDRNFQFLFIALFGFIGRLFNHFLNGSAVTKSVVSQHYKRQFQPFDEKIVLKPEQFVVASTVDNRVVSQQAIFTSEAKAHEFMQAEVARDASRRALLHVISADEVNIEG